MSEEDEQPSSAPPFIQTHNILNRSISIASTAARPSVKRLNRIKALAALEGKHKRSFWDEDDEVEHLPPMEESPSSMEPSPEVETPPPFPLQDLNTNIEPTPLNRKRSSTIESWFVPSLDPFDFEQEKEDEKEMWRRLDLAGVNFGLVS